ncbi:MAG: S-layer homology domain-containing protein [Oscillospiraceae bacterium]|nr:S-layer homology domain-containing protein [Oscillospiraceae bacterium]
MKTLKTMLSLLLVLSLLAAVPAAVSAAEAFPDEGSATFWAADGIRSLYELGIIPEEIQGDYTRPITRYEYTLLALNYIEYTQQKDLVALIEDTGHEGLAERYGESWFEDCDDPRITGALWLGIISGGGSGMFYPDLTLSREQAAQMIYNLGGYLRYYRRASAFGVFEDEDETSEWALPGLGYVTYFRIMQGSNNLFMPKVDYTREQSIVTFSNMLPPEELTEWAVEDYLTKSEEDHRQSEWYDLYYLDEQICDLLFQEFLAGIEITHIRSTDTLRVDIHDTSLPHPLYPQIMVSFYGPWPLMYGYNTNNPDPVKSLWGVELGEPVHLSQSGVQEVGILFGIRHEVNNVIAFDRLIYGEKYYNIWFDFNKNPYLPPEEEQRVYIVRITRADEKISGLYTNDEFWGDLENGEHVIFGLKVTITD